MANKLEKLKKEMEELEKREGYARYKHYEILTASISAELILEVAKEGHTDGDITDKTLGIVSAYAKAIKTVSAYAESEHEVIRGISFRAFCAHNRELNKNNDK